MNSEPNNKWYQRNVFWSILISGIAGILTVFFLLVDSIERFLRGEGKLADLVLWPIVLTIVLLVLIVGLVWLLVFVIRKNLLRNRGGQLFTAAVFVLYVLGVLLFVPRPSAIETI